MILRPYEDRDYRTLREWYQAWKVPAPLKEFLPKTGYIADGIACGFLILTDASMGILEFYISNKDAPKEERDEALDRITKLLMNFARNSGCLFIKADTQNQCVSHRAIKHGFFELGKYTSFVREI